MDGDLVKGVFQGERIFLNNRACDRTGTALCIMLPDRNLWQGFQFWGYVTPVAQLSAVDLSTLIGKIDVLYQLLEHYPEIKQFITGRSTVSFYAQAKSARFDAATLDQDTSETIVIHNHLLQVTSVINEQYEADLENHTLKRVAD